MKVKCLSLKGREFKTIKIQTSCGQSTGVMVKAPIFFFFPQRQPTHRLTSLWVIISRVFLWLTQCSPPKNNWQLTQKAPNFQPALKQHISQCLLQFTRHYLFLLKFILEQNARKHTRVKLLGEAAHLLTVVRGQVFITCQK